MPNERALRCLMTHEMNENTIPRDSELVGNGRIKKRNKIDEKNVGAHCLRISSVVIFIQRWIEWEMSYASTSNAYKSQTLNHYSKTYRKPIIIITARARRGLIPRALKNEIARDFLYRKPTMGDFFLCALRNRCLRVAAKATGQ